MPLFKSRRRDEEGPVNEKAPLPPSEYRAPSAPPVQPERPDTPPQPKLVFHCQLAHGSPTGIISGFGNVKELYQRIAECYEMSASEVRRGARCGIPGDHWLSCSSGKRIVFQCCVFSRWWLRHGRNFSN